MIWSRSRFACFTLLAATLLCTLQLPAQEARWLELNSRATELYQQGKYAECVPVVTEALKIAEATFGPDDARIGTSLYNLARTDDSLGRYGEAEPLYQRALRIDEKTLGPNHLDVANCLNSLALLYYNQGKYEQAEPLYQRALRIQEKALGPDHADVATTLNNLARLYDDMGKYAEVEPLYQRALRIREKALGPDHPEVANTLNGLAMLYDQQSKYAEAEPLFQRALRIDEKVLGPESPEVATDLNNLGLLYVDQSRYKEAEPLYQRSLRIREKVLGPEDPELATSLINLATLSQDEGKYAEAEALYQRGLHIDEKALGPDHPGLATDLDDLAELYDEIGRSDEAVPLYQRALRIREKALGPDSPPVATALNNLASLYSDHGKYREAEPLFQRALRIDEKALGPEHPHVAVDLNNLGLLYYRQGNYGKAQPLYERALRIDEKVSPDSPGVATDLNNLALLYADQDEYAQAEPLYQRSLRIKEKALGPDDPSIPTSLNNLGTLYVHQDKYGEAEPLFRRALQIRERAFGPDNLLIAVELNNLGVLYADQGKYGEAEPLYQRALRIHETALGPEHPNVAIDLSNLAGLYVDQGKYAEAEPLFRRALDNLFQQFQYNFTYMTEQERLGFLHTVFDYFPVYFSFVHLYHEKDPQLTGSMYNLLLWDKSLIVGSVADMRRQVEASGDMEALKLLGQLSAKRTQIAALQNAQPPDRDLWRKQMDQLTTEANDTEKALVARSSVFAAQKKLERATWQQVRDALGPQEAAVELTRFFFYDKKRADTSYYAALVITRETKDHPQYIFLGNRQQIQDDAVVRFQHAVQARGSALQPDAELPGAHAYELIFKPLEGALAGKTRVYLSPDGILNQLPLGIIPAPGNQLLMEKYDLRLLSSTRDILRPAPAHAAAATALLVGDPVFDLSEEQQRAAMHRLALPQGQEPVLMAALSPADRSRDLGSGSVLPRLPGTGAEVNAIAELMQQRQWKTRVYTNDVALKRVVEQAGSPRVVHLATHGFFLPDQSPDHPIKAGAVGLGEQSSRLEDPMLRSGLYFAGADRTLAGKPTVPGLDNGVLTAMEASSLDLRGTELVVLSACNTGQGDVRNGEGVFGLRRALQEAGAQSVMMSLWSVPDKETLELMKRFYTKWLAGMEIHQALKEAQLELREQVRASHGGTDLPYYWGAFVLVGR